MAGEAAAAAARLPGAFPAARNGGVRRALRVPGSAATSGPVLRGLRGRRRAAGGAAEGLRRAKGNGAGLPSPARTSPSAGGRGAVPRAPAGRGGRWCPVLGALVGRQRAAVAGKCPSRPAPHCPLSLGGKTKRPWSREGEGAAVAPAVPSSPPPPPPLSPRAAQGTPAFLPEPLRAERGPWGRGAAEGAPLRRVLPAASRAAECSPPPACGAAPGRGAVDRGDSGRRPRCCGRRTRGCGAAPLRAAPSRPTTPLQRQELGGCGPWHGSGYVLSPEAPVCLKSVCCPSLLGWGVCFRS